MDVSIIIVNYNTSKLINDCISSIFDRVIGIEYEIIIVDNNTEELSKVITASEDSHVKLLQLPENIGFGLANNAGAKIAAGKYLFLLNPDTVLMNNAVKILYDFAETHTNVGACGGNLYDENIQPAHSFRLSRPGIKQEINNLFCGLLDRIKYGHSLVFNYNDKPLKVGYITGADLMILKSNFQKVGGFSKAFFMYYEETDLCERLSRLNLSIFSVPDANIQHLDGKSFNNNNDNLRRISIVETSRKIYMSKNFNKLNTLCCNAIYFIYLLSRSLMVSNPNSRKTYRLRLKWLLQGHVDTQ